MKKTFLSVFCGLVLSALFYSCVDDNTLGFSILPSQDTVSVSFDTIRVQSETILQDSVYLRNSVAVLGEFTDPTYGTLRSDFMAQLYCPYNFKFPDDVATIDSAYMYLYYNSWFGDSTTVHHLNVWYLDKNPLDASLPYGSTTDISRFTSKSKLLASGLFTTGDFQTSDSAKALSSYLPVLKLPLNKEFCKQFLEDNQKYPGKFASPSIFNKYFNGIYVTTDYGNGSLLYISHSEIEMRYNTYMYSNSSNKTLRDSLVVGGSYFPVNKEVRQINRAEHPDLSSYLVPSSNDSLNYVYAPGGMFTKVTLPNSIFQKGTGKLSGKTVNGMKLYVNATQVETKNEYALTPPASMLLIDASKVNAFFSGFNLNDGLYSFVANYDADSMNYVFDLSYYAQKMIRENDKPASTEFKPFTEMLLIPVNTVQNSDRDNVRLEHVISPEAVKIQSGNHPKRPMQLRVIYSNKR
ncbi:MAG TPA: DUF4270 domain-containing protein [Bacteroidales bacterium]|nr:DUF4270 domain-containing protein [Bacteroidales bacterium]